MNETDRKTKRISLKHDLPIMGSPLKGIFETDNFSINVQTAKKKRNYIISGKQYKSKLYIYI